LRLETVFGLAGDTFVVDALEKHLDVFGTPLGIVGLVLTAVCLFCLFLGFGHGVEQCIFNWK